MSTAEYTLDSLAALDCSLCKLSQARGGPEVVEFVREYLAGWPAERVARIQRIDAGWAPFDEYQRPAPLFRPADLRKIGAAVHEQCAALSGAGVAPVSELLELDHYLRFACAKLEELAPGAPGTARHAL
jgi:hypothetical protein